MGAAVLLRLDHTASDLRRLARESSDSDQVRRLLALAVISAGGPRREAALVGGVGLQTVRLRVLRFNAWGAAGVLDGKAPGARALLNDLQRAALPGLSRPSQFGPVRFWPNMAWCAGGWSILLPGCRAASGSRSARRP